MTPVDYDDLLDRELKRLPGPVAPATLLRSVMAAVSERSAAPWYERAWLTWPLAAQVLSIAGLLGLLAAIGWALPGAQRATGEWAAVIDVREPARLLAVLRVIRQAAALMRVSWEVLLQPVAVYVGLLTLAVSLGCAALWTTLNRFALGGASHQ